jgi:hypothetical protein
MLFVDFDGKRQQAIQAGIYGFLKLKSVVFTDGA